MIEAKFNTLPHEILSEILLYLDWKDILRLYRTSHYWKRKIGSNEVIWRSIYERNFGHEFVKDRWILWAVRRLWSQSPLGERRLAARHVSLATLEHLDAYTWRRLVYGRILTEKNWRNNSVQRSVYFPKEPLKTCLWFMKDMYARNTYGITYISQEKGKVNFAIVDDTLNNASQIHLPNEHTSETNHQKSNVFRGRMASIDQKIDDIFFLNDVTSEEFIVATREIPRYDEEVLYPEAQVLLAWDFGRLVAHHIVDDDQSYCTPSLCMTELLPDVGYRSLEQQGGWLIVLGHDISNDRIQKKYQQYFLYDIRRGRLAASFAVEEDIRPIIGKATANLVQIYYGYVTKFTENNAFNHYRYHWHLIEISIENDIQLAAIDLTLCDQMPTHKMLKKAQVKYRFVQEYVKMRGHWCDGNYSLETTTAKEAIPLTRLMGSRIRVRHLVDDLFLLSRPEKVAMYGDVFVVHSVRQQRVLWTKNAFSFNLIIPDERAIFIYKNQMGELLDMYTGNVLSSVKIGHFAMIQHVIGPICRVLRDRDILVDVRTGAEIRALEPVPVAKSFMGFTQVGIEQFGLKDISKAVRMEYIDQSQDIIWIDEYGQV